jgi:hypothetical protein
MQSGGVYWKSQNFLWTKSGLRILKTPPRRLFVQSRAEQNILPILLEEFFGGARKSGKAEKIFLLASDSNDAGGGAASIRQEFLINPRT